MDMVHGYYGHLFYYDGMKIKNKKKTTTELLTDWYTDN